MGRTRIETLSRRNLILTVLAVVLLGWVFLRPDTVRGVSRGDLAAALPAFDASDVRRIEITQKAPGDDGVSKRLIVERQSDEAWVLPERFGVAVLPGAAARLLDAVADARERTSVTKRAETFDKYRKGDGWRYVRLVDGQGGEVVSFGVGRADRAELFIKRGPPDNAEIIRAVNVRPTAFSTDVSDWIDRQLWPSDLKSKDVVRVDITRQGSAQPIVALKRGITGEAAQGVAAPDVDPDDKELTWWIASPNPPGDADALEVEDLIRAATGLMVNDVVHGGSGDEQRFGFDNPALRLTLWQDLGAGKTRKYELVVGGRDDADDAYVRRGDAPYTYTVPAAGSLSQIDVTVEDLRRAPERGDGPAGGN